MARTAQMIANEQAVANAMQTFITSTLPPLATTAYNEAAKSGPEYSTMNIEPHTAFYAACKQYADALIARGIITGPNPLPFR